MEILYFVLHVARMLHNLHVLVYVPCLSYMFPLVMLCFVFVLFKYYVPAMCFARIQNNLHALVYAPCACYMFPLVMFCNAFVS